MSLANEQTLWGCLSADGGALYIEGRASDWAKLAETVALAAQSTILLGLGEGSPGSRALEAIEIEPVPGEDLVIDPTGDRVTVRVGAAVRERFCKNLLFHARNEGSEIWHLEPKSTANLRTNLHTISFVRAGPVA